MGRVRRGAVSSIAGGGPTVRVTVNKPNRVKVVEIWKELVKKRWNPESRFLNLEVRARRFEQLNGFSEQSDKNRPANAFHAAFTQHVS